MGDMDKIHFSNSSSVSMHSEGYSSHSVCLQITPQGRRTAEIGASLLGKETKLDDPLDA